MGAGSPSSDETRWPSFSNACHSLHSLQLPACFNPNSKLTDSINCTACSGFWCYFGPKCHLLHPIIHIGQAHNKFPTCIQNLEGETQCIFCQCQYKALLFTHREIKREIPLIIERSSHLHSFCKTYSCMSKSGIQLAASVLPNMDKLFLGRLWLTISFN